MDSSKFNLWRAVFSFCHIDSHLADQERIWLEEKSQMLKLTTEQKTQLLSDISNPPDMLAILPLITKPSDRAFLVDQMRVLAHIDGDFSEAEKVRINQIRDLVLQKVDLEALEKIIAEDELSSYHENEVYKVHNKGSVLEGLHRYAQKTLNPGDYKLPKKD